MAQRRSCRLESDRLLDDPTGFFGISTDRLIMQAFIRVESGMVWLSNGQKFHAKQGLQGKGHNYYNAIVWLERTRRRGIHRDH